MTAATRIVPRTPLHPWIAEKIGISSGRLSRDAITRYQLQALRESIRRVREHSPFYSDHLRLVDAARIEASEDLRTIPFTTPHHLASHAPRMLCVSQDEVSRVVTHATSGTSGDPKRLFFSSADQEGALDFFAHGVLTLASPGDRMLIALPGERPGSVGQMLAQGIERSGVQPIGYGLIQDPQHALEAMGRAGATSIIGLPVQLILLASQKGPLADRVFSRLKSIVLCSDHVPPPVVCRLRQRTGCEVFQHYGMTETGLGGGIDCRAHEGYHLREADLFFEIVDPGTGEPVPEGSSGEIVFSTLVPGAMPLIRYRTGDISSFAPHRCACGSCLRVLRYLRTRVDGIVRIGNSGEFCLADLEDTLFALTDVIDLACTLTRGEPSELAIVLRTANKRYDGLMGRARKELGKIPAFGSGCAAGELRLQISATREALLFSGVKRCLEVRTP